MPDLWSHWTDLNQTWTHIHLWRAIWKIWSKLLGHLPPMGWGGAKSRFLEPTLNFHQTYLCNRNMISTIGKKWIYRDFPACRLNSVNLGPETAENGSRVFVPPSPIFTLEDTTSLIAWTLYNRQQANFGTCYIVARAYSLEQQNAGRAHAGLCKHRGCWM